MSRYARERTEPALKPVQRIELSDKNTKLRVIIVIVAIVVAALAIGYGVHSCLSAEAGWTKIDVSSIANSVAGEFLFNYELGQGSASATTERKTLTALYAAAAVEAYKLYDPFAEDGGLREIIEKPGVEVKIDSDLYSALEMTVKACGRFIYREPYNEIYELLAGAEDDEVAASYDPRKNADMRARFDKIAAFINDENSIDLKFLGSNKVRLDVSDEYKAFAAENEIYSYIGFSWLKNAFAADHIAERLRNAGYTLGYLTSMDGFTVYLNGADSVYSVNLYAATENGIGVVCTPELKGAVSGVYLRCFPISSRTGGYVYGDGSFVMPYADDNGDSKTAAEVLYMYSGTKSCAQVALEAANIYQSDNIDEQALKQALDGGTCALYINKGVIRYTDVDLTLSGVYGSYSTGVIK